jgi:hypothetical protein
VGVQRLGGHVGMEVPEQEPGGIEAAFVDERRFVRVAGGRAEPAVLGELG